MRIGVPRQHGEGETRSPLTPSVIKKLVDLGLEVQIEAGAGEAAHISDEQFTEAGATIASDGDALWAEADLIVTLEPPAPDAARRMKSGAVLMGMLAPLANHELVGALRDGGVTAFSMEFVPRISRAQAMDVLSSQANLGGYKAVILAADHVAKMLPMMITAAGTIAPARVFVIGAGVAGLQAIATAKRLGAVVEAYDVRAVTKEQVQSLGARFVELPTAQQEDKATGGYAKEQTDEERRQQAELMAKHVTGADAVITTAAVFGKAPPMLIPADVVDRMNRGAVIVDLAASAAHGRGNCEQTEPGKVITTDNGVTIIGFTNLPALLAANASQVYANNMLAFIREIVTDSQLKLDVEDEVQAGALITHQGAIRNDMVREAIEPASNEANQESEPPSE